ncbi:hypothetical protein AGMMS50262_21100 [Bacteroidia bacterium]|nr:hypothetical protein AGMMS50262_21100 [Bacteroidia bacterium]
MKKECYISVFEKSGSWAKIRFQKQWAYVKTQDIKYILYHYWEVTANNATVYKDKDDRKRVASLKKGTVIDVSVIDPSGQFASISYNRNVEYKNFKYGVVSINDIQPLPRCYEIIADNPKSYVTTNIKGNYYDQNKGEIIMFPIISEGYRDNNFIEGFGYFQLNPHCSHPFIEVLKDQKYPS